MRKFHIRRRPSLCFLKKGMEKGMKRAVSGLTFSNKYRMIVDGINNSASPGSY